MRLTPMLVFLSVVSGVCSAQNAPLVRSAVAQHYPPVAVAARVAGTVSVRVHIDPAGAVLRAEAMEGPRLLTGASEEAARLWRFEPSADGERTVTLRFVYVLLPETEDAGYEVKFVPSYEVIIEKHPANQSFNYGTAKK